MATARCTLVALSLAIGSGALFGSACSDGEEGETASDGNAGSGGDGTGTATGGNAGAGLGPGTIDVPMTEQDGSTGPSACQIQAAAETELERVHLYFAFDVSGSMGKLDYPYHDPELKWEPVVSATKAFFEDPASVGIAATLTFFPIDDEDGRCDSETYDEPDVPLTELPSTAFGDAIDAITPESSDDWRGGTPTLAVVEGTLDFAMAAEAEPGVRRAFVLVSDGYPQNCDDDSIDSVASAVEAVADTLPTYVIGVANPSGGPDTVSDLDAIAVAGNTGHAFIVATDDPEATKSAFLAAVREIRSAALSCEFAIPPVPAGQVFDPELANVAYSSDAGTEDLVFDPLCEADRAWRYDDAEAPSRMELCDTTCTTVRADPGAKLTVSFGCRRRDVLY